MRRERTLGLWMARALALALMVVSAPALHAQFGGGMRDVADPEVDSQQLDTIAEMLDFSNQQRELASQLLQGYLAEMTRLGENVRAMMDGARAEFRETRDPRVWQDLMEAMGPFEEEKRTITQRFMEDLRLILEPEQDDKWDDVERFHRRYTSFSDDALLSGENVDLIAAVGDMDLPADQMAAVEPILEQYALEIDRALRERNKVYEESMEGAMQLWRDQDFEEMQKRFDNSRDAAETVRDVNRRFAREVETTLEREFASEWSREFKARSFPRVYRATPTVEAFETALAFDDLTPEQREEISAMRDAYRARVGSVNDEIAGAIEESEMSRSIMSFFGRGRNNDSNEVREARDEKRELERQTQDRLRALLTEDQRDRLPDRESNRDWRDRLPNR
jgi:hypothetical protein